ncbi:MAG: RodZ domain-containing protein [Chloroflexota bacterium]
MTQTIGQKLKEARVSQHLTLDKVSEFTRIRAPYLQALEVDDFSAMPSPVQARGFLRNYAEYLGLNIEQLLDELRSEQKPLDEIIGPNSFSDQLPNPTPAPVQQAAPPSKSEPASVIQTESQLEVIEEPVTSNEPMVVIEVPVETQSEEVILQPDVTENLWRTWLNRISSILPARTKSVPPEPTLESDNSLSEEPQVQEQFNVLDGLESTQIFKEIGAELCKRRELLSLHLGEVERSTHVKAHYLDALEKGAMDNLPSTVQTRGMLSNYATFLDLDVDAILLRYADALQARHREKNPHKPLRKPGEPIIANIPSIRNFIAGDMIFGVGMAVLLIGFCIWGINRVMMIQSLREVQPTAPSISDMLLASPDPSLITPTATLAQIESIVEATETILIPTQNLNVNVQVNLVAVERTFMRVVVDGKEVFNGRVVPGTAYPFEAENQIEVLVGSGAAIRIVYNGHDLGLLGGLGQVIDNIYREAEIITPTVQPTPTITKTPPGITTTALPTLTPVPSDTPTP